MYEFQNIIINDTNKNLLNKHLSNERYNAIDKISTDVMQVNKIVIDLASIVTEQGSCLDNIEYNINQTAINIEKGKNVIVKIDKKDKKKGKCLCNTIYLCIIVNSIFLVILIIKIIR